MGELPRGTPKLGKRRSGAVEAGGVTCGSNAHLRPPRVMSTYRSRAKSSTRRLHLHRMHQESYVHDVALLVRPSAWNRRKKGAGVRRESGPVAG